MLGYSTNRVRVAVRVGIVLLVIGFLVGNHSEEGRILVSSPPAVAPQALQTGAELAPTKTFLPPQEVAVKVTFVVDGDTIELATGQRVRLIGIDAPESGSPYYSEARNELVRLVLNKDVRLEKDVTETDRYERLLRYVYVGQTFVNLEMVRSGYATSYRYPPDVKYQEQLFAAEQESKTAKSGR